MGTNNPVRDTQHRWAGRCSRWACRSAQREAGAWGIAVVSVFGMATACLCLIHAAMTSPPGRAPPPTRRARMLPEQDQPGDRRAILDFRGLTIPGASATLAAGLGARAIAGRAGMGAADGNVLTLFLMPVLWAVIASVQLMWPSRRAQALLIVIPALAGLIRLSRRGRCHERDRA